jgi:hypothetical protein
LSCRESCTFNGPAQNCCQLSRNLPWEAGPCCYATKLGPKKNIATPNTDHGPCCYATKLGQKKTLRLLILITEGSERSVPGSNSCPQD